MLTPLDISDKEFRRAIRGYNEEEVDNFLDRVLRDYEILYKENLRLKEQMVEVEQTLGHYQRLEETLSKTLVLAQETAEEVRKNAEKEADIAIKEARLEGENIISRAQEEAAKIAEQYREIQRLAKAFKAKLRADLLSQLHLLEDEEEPIRVVE